MIKFKKLEYVILNRKKWLYFHSAFSLQCAYCIFLQPHKIIRNKEGLVIGVDVNPQDEQHAFDCKQK